MEALDNLAIKIFADGADLDGMKALSKSPMIKGFTTNPTLMRQAGVTDYAAFAAEVLKELPNLPVSFEVFADDLPTMEAQAKVIATLADNVNVKIPVTNTKGESTAGIIERLSAEGVVVNVTALFTAEQVKTVCAALSPDTDAIISVFAGRIADTGRDPIPVMQDCLEIMADRPKSELLWASPRELFNIFEADRIGCHIITVSHGVLGKLKTVGKDLDQFSLETVKMFYDDASSAGYTIAV